MGRVGEGGLMQARAKDDFRDGRGLSVSVIAGKYYSAH